MIIFFLGYSKSASTSISYNILYGSTKFKSFNLTESKDLYFKDINKDIRSLDSKKNYFIHFSQWPRIDINRSVEIIKLILKLIPNAKFILSIRNQAEWFKSFYLHEISTNKFPKSGSISDFLNCKLKSGFGNAKNQLNFYEKINFLKQVLKKENFKLFFFEELTPESLTSDLVEFLNISIDENFEKSSCLKQRDKSELIQKKFMSRVNSLGYLRMKYNFLPNVRFSKFISNNLLKKYYKFIRPKQISLKKEDLNLLKQCFLNSNKKLKSLVKKDLKKYGYFFE